MQALLEKNPWNNLTDHAPFVLSEDEAVVNQYNNKKPGILATHVMPAPFQGRHDARVVLLNLNPAYGEVVRTAQNNSEKWRKALRRALSLDQTFWPLWPEMKGLPGYEHWNGKWLGDLISVVGRDKVIERTLCVQALGYHSKDKPSGMMSLWEMNSVNFARKLVEKAEANGALIMRMRGPEVWSKYPTPKNPQTWSRSASMRRHVIPEWFDKLVAAYG